MSGRIAAGAHGGLPLNSHGRHPKVFVRRSIGVKGPKDGRLCCLSSSDPFSSTPRPSH